MDSKININNDENTNINGTNSNSESLTTINGIIIGKSNSGKTYLKNGIEKYLEFQNHGCDIILREFPGFELSQNQQTIVKNDILNTIEDSFSSFNINDAIHYIIYCINSQGNRIDIEEINFLNFLYNTFENMHISIIIVLTQAIDEKKVNIFKSVIQERLEFVKIVPLLAEDIEFINIQPKKAYGINNLIKIMVKEFPHQMKRSLQNYEIMHMKLLYSKKVLFISCLISFCVSFILIPYVDLLLLLLIQSIMIFIIRHSFNLKYDNIMGNSVKVILYLISLSSIEKLIFWSIYNKVSNYYISIVLDIISGLVIIGFTYIIGSIYIRNMKSSYMDMKNLELLNN